MSSFTAVLYLDGHEYPLVWCQYSFRQRTDRRGRPASKVIKGPLHAEFDATRDYPELRQLTADSYKVLSGRLVFRRSDHESALRHVWFTEAAAVNYYEAFSSEGVLVALFSHAPACARSTWYN